MSKPDAPKDMAKAMAAFVTGVGVGAALYHFLFVKKAKRGANIDHVVIDAKSEKRLQEHIKFYSEGLGFKIARMDGYRAYQKGAKSLVFPTVRVNDTQLIDLFPFELMEKFGCKRKQGPVDHVCISLSIDDHHATMRRLASLGFDLISHGVRSGAEGEGYSTYYYDPNDMWVEIRNYDRAKWNSTKELATKLQKK
mmetsp:Transcript_11186/g.27505  ORF Transcript_11186/g.27505 Transcript_11186/m.27505 type:complete len:195 (-) Transcript_11186:170-754(-)|eukprot:CAMPEP_0114500296 /NCGR_PEP_ID=MMETSP0109-20121206/7887_1 /TAXON_ID=29199 /ORGANISM="Chlorarachnion reptans, Strain CCCM449" /LENGTH=194 /DNA_ID=CAMNT_0001677945 /DNA_START=73 /DNA_END=657 /DNA_ORIENTATION=+